MTRETFRTSLLQNKDRVFNHALYLLKCQEDAEDATQEVFVRLWKNRRKIEEVTAVAWIMRTTHNLCLDLIRRRRTSTGRLRRSSGTDMDAFAAEADRHTNPEEQYEFNRQQVELATAMEDLSPRTQSILLLHYFHGFKYEAIAEILEMKLGTVKVAVHRGKGELRKLLSRSNKTATGESRHERAVQ